MYEILSASRLNYSVTSKARYAPRFATLLPLRRSNVLRDRILFLFAEILNCVKTNHTHKFMLKKENHSLLCCAFLLSN